MIDARDAPCFPADARHRVRVSCVEMKIRRSPWGGPAATARHGHETTSVTRASRPTIGRSFLRAEAVSMSAYGPLCQQFYDADKGFADEDEVRWYASRLPRDAGPVLEAMCGSGRLLVPLLREGFHVHGADDSAPMLAACEARLAASGRAAPLFRQDVAGLNLPFRYGAALVAAGSLQLIVDPSRMRRALEGIRAHLVPPGLLLLDLDVPDLALHPPGAALVEVRSVRLDDGSRITLRSETSVDAEARQIEMRNRYERRGPRVVVAQREDETLRMTWMDASETATLLRATGFVDITILHSPWPRAAGSFAASARIA